MEPKIGMMFLQRNHTVLDLRQGILNFPYFSMQLKTADHKYSNVMEPVLSPDDITIPPNDRATGTVISQIYPEYILTGVKQPSDFLNEEGDITFCAAIVTLAKGATSFHINNFTNQKYKLKKRATYNKCLGIDSGTNETWHLQNESEKNATCYVSSLLKTNRNNDQYEQYWFPTPKNPGDQETHTPIQARIKQELSNLQNAEKLDPQVNEEFRQKFPCNFD